MNNIMIGILAGMGPRSTTPFLEQVLDQCQEQYGAKYDEDYPHIIIYSLPTPFYINREVIDEELKASIVEGAKKLEVCGVDFIAIPCNTAHKYIEDINDAINVPVINIIEETTKRIIKGKRVAVFATDSTMSTGLYQNGITDNGSDYYFLDNWQLKVNKIITMIKEGKKREIIMGEWNNLINEVISYDVESLIIACTDLSVLLEEIDKFQIIDSSNTLAKALIKKYISMKDNNSTSKLKNTKNNEGIP